MLISGRNGFEKGKTLSWIWSNIGDVQVRHIGIGAMGVISMKSPCALEGGTGQVENQARAGYRSFRVWKFPALDADTCCAYCAGFYIYEQIEIVFTHNS